MPSSWHDRYSLDRIKDDKTRAFYRKIIADKKPYFMRYIYPQLMKQYKTYMKNTNRNSLREFHLSTLELCSLKFEDETERQREFLRMYRYKMPVGTNDCVMNRICRRFESEFVSFIKKSNESSDFDYSILRSNAEYTQSQFYEIKKLYRNYNKRLQSYKVFSDYERLDKIDSSSQMDMMSDEFEKMCIEQCSNEEKMCNIILDICYTRSASRKFAWSMCRHSIIRNLLKKNDYMITYPTRDENGEFEYRGDRYTVKTKRIEVGEWQSY